MAFFSVVMKMLMDTTEVSTGLKKTESQLKKWSDGIASDLKGRLGGIFTVAAAGMAAKAVLDYAGKVVDLADAYGMTTEEVQRLNYAATQNGVELETLAQITAKLSQRRADALSGDEKAIIAFERMGFSLKELAKEELTAFEMTKRVGEASSSRKDKLLKESDMMDLLGAKSAKATKALQDLSSVTPVSIITDSELRRVDELGNKLGDLALKAKNLAVSYSGQIIGFFESTSKADKAYEKAIKQGLTEKKAREEYSRVFLETMSGIKLERVNGKLRAVNDEKKQDLPQGYNIAGRDTGEMFGPEPLKKEKEKQKADATGSPFLRGGSLSEVGGFFFGQSYQAKTLQSLELSVAELKKIAESTKQTATALKE